MGSTGDSPVPVGDSPTGRSKRLPAKRPSLLPPGALPVPPGESPGGTGQWPVLPKNEFPDTVMGIVLHASVTQCSRQHVIKTCQNDPFRRYFGRMSIDAKKVAEVLALPERDRAFLARQLIASLDDAVDIEAETPWQEVIHRRAREIEEGKVSCRPVEQVVQGVRAKLRARRRSS